MSDEYKTQSFVHNRVDEDGYGSVEIINKEWRFGLHYDENEGFFWIYAGRDNMDCGVFSEDTKEHLTSMLAGIKKE